ncbi:MAG: glycosyltransferase family 39 protein [Candidatus Curtissbacteria bacterium]|nr:glycosyltransferase family 39 protein [Candidatus Curtissbacteria bacterium]
MIVTLAFILRLTPGLSTLLFTYDQARDAFFAQSITKGHLKIVGPPSDIPGFFHGPLFYYVISPFYFLGSGDPQVVLIEMILINLLVLIPLWQLTQKLFKNTSISIVALILYAVSFEAVSYARWISNPSLAVPAIAFFYLGLWQIVHKQKGGWVMTFLALGLAIQTQIFLVYLILSALVTLAIANVRYFPRKEMLLGASGFLFLISSFAVAELKFKFQGIKGAADFFAGNIGAKTALDTQLMEYLKKWQEQLSNNLFPQSGPISVILGLAIISFAIYLAKTDKKIRKPLLFLLILLFANIPIFIVSSFSSYYITLGSLIPLLVLTAYFLHRVSLFSKYAFVLIIGAIILTNSLTVFEKNQKGSVLFRIQDGMIFKDEMALVKKTYEISPVQRFSINAVTNPLYIPTTWAYLYQLYAKQNNLLLPHFHGNTASTFPGIEVFPRSGEITKTEFTIIEPSLDRQWPHWIQKTTEEDNLRKPISYEVNIGHFQLLVRE